MGDDCKMCIKAGTKDDTAHINDLVSQCPELHSKIGKIAREAFVSKLKRSTPGRHTEAYFQKGQTFVNIFFPKHNATTYEGDITRIMPQLNDGYWSDFSVAALCQSMYYQTHNIRKQLEIGKINSAVNSRNEELHQNAFDWYKYVFSRRVHGYSPSHSTKDIYLKIINSSYWIQLHKLKYSQGQWINPEWKVFHQCVKLSCLGASDNEINSWLHNCIKNGLNIPNTVRENKWRNYLVWLIPTDINHEDIDGEAKHGMLVSVYISSMSPYGGGSSMAEENSYEFTANGQPGSGYRSTGSSCCFTKDTKILMHDNNLKKISSVKVGDSVKTQNGSAKVLFVSLTTQKDRTLYSINDLPFRFTDTQPFVNFSNKEQTSQPVYATVRPDRLQSFCPTLGWEGIGKLSENSTLVCGTDLKPQTIKSIASHNIHSATDAVELLYDIIVTPNETTGHFEYFVGSEDAVFLAVAELSSVPGATTYTLEATLTILLIIRITSKLLSAHFKSMAFDDIFAKLELLLKVTNTQLYHSLYSSKKFSTLEGNTSSSPLPKNDVLNIIIKELANSFNHESDFENIVISKLFELLNFYHLRELEQFYALQWRQKPSLIGAKYIAITVLQFDIDYHGLQEAESKKSGRLVLKLQNDEKKLYKRSMLPVETRSTPYQIGFFQCLYLQMDWFQNNSKEIMIEIYLYDEEVEYCLYQGANDVVDISREYGRYKIQMFDQEKLPKGCVSLDVRYLTDESVMKEKEDFSNQKEVNNLNLVEPIAESYSRYISSIYYSVL